jgi:hypothetical protein
MSIVVKYLKCGVVRIRKDLITLILRIYKVKQVKVYSFQSMLKPKLKFPQSHD